jgi:hypothetical protein
LLKKRERKRLKKYRCKKHIPLHKKRGEIRTRKKRVKIER